MKSKRYKFIRGIILIMTLLTTVTSISCDKYHSDTEEFIDYPLKISVLDIGKADCIILEIRNKILMIDSGKHKNYDMIKKELEDRNIKKIDYLILSHLDKDHIGGVSQLLDDYEVDNITQADYEKDNEEYKDYINSLKKHSVTPVLLHEIKEIKIEDVILTIYPGKQKQYKHSNDYSLIVDINYKKNNFLFMGDAEKIRLSEFIEFNEKKYDFIKMPHHGRIDELTEKFIDLTRPKYTAITCSKESSVDNEVKDILSKFQVESYLSCNGTINLYSNGESIKCAQIK